MFASEEMGPQQPGKRSGIDDSVGRELTQALCRAAIFIGGLSRSTMMMSGCTQISSCVGTVHTQWIFRRDSPSVQTALVSAFSAKIKAKRIDGGSEFDSLLERSATFRRFFIASAESIQRCTRGLTLRLPDGAAAAGSFEPESELAIPANHGKSRS